MVAGFALVGSSPRPESSLGATGTGLALLAGFALVARGIATWRARKQQEASRRDVHARLTQRVAMLEGRIEQSQAAHEGAFQRQLQHEQAHHEQLERMQAHHDEQIERMHQRHDRKLAEILASLAALQDAIRGADDDGADVYDVQWKRRR